MEIEYDTVKNKANIAKHGIDFALVRELEWASAVILEDSCIDYGEIRYIAYIMLKERLYILIFTWRNGIMRPISFRKANKREVKYYEKEKNNIS